MKPIISNLAEKRIALLTLQHFSNAPRAQKEAEALSKAGADVTVFGAWWDRERAEEDAELAKSVQARFVPLLDLRHGEGGTFLPRLAGKVATVIYRHTGIVFPEVYGLTARKMLRAVRKLKPDLVMVHCEPGLWAGCRLLDLGFRVGIDFEDWFSEDLLPEDRLNRPVEALGQAEKRLLREGAVCFAPTDAMALRLAEWAEVSIPPLTIPNSFPWARAPEPNDPRQDKRDSEAVSLYWYSQTIGPGRGLEALAKALHRLKGNWQLHLRGNASWHEEWVNATFTPKIRNRVIVHSAVSNEDLSSCGVGHDLGLALEVPHCPSRDLTATNKIFEYLRSGLAVLATSTEGQREVMAACPEAGWIIEPNDVDGMVRILQKCIDQPGQMKAAKRVARRAAEEIWSWECFEPQLVKAVAESFRS